MLIPLRGGKPSLSALSIAQACLNTLLHDGEQALSDIKTQNVSDAVENIIEANTYMSGIGFESGGLAAAHAIHNGFTVLEETHSALHGEKVTFGTIVQLVLEDASSEEINKILAFCCNIGLPVCLKQFGVDKTTADIRSVAKETCKEGETIYNMPFEISEEKVYQAILKADEIGESFLTK